MADLQSILTRLVSDNRQSRERFGGIASRTVSAVMQGNTDELNNIIRDVATAESSGESGDKPLETGDTDGPSGDQGNAGSPV